MKNIIFKIVKKYKDIIAWSLMYIGLFIVVECFQRSSIIEGIKFPFMHPFITLYNILFMVSLSGFIVLFKKKKVMFLLYSLVWVGLSCTSGIKADFRGDPLMAQDFFLMKEAGNVAGAYLNINKIIMIAFLIISSIILIKFTSMKEKNSKRFAKKSIMICIAMFVVVFPFVSRPWLSAMSVEPIRWDMKASYFKYGFAYSFSETVASLKPEKPDTYSKETIATIKDQINETVMSNKDESVQANKDNSEVKPNVIGFLLEAFFDPTTLPGVTFSRDPIPNFRKLQSMYTTGKMDVAVIGGGTVNTEFEVFTSMNTKLLSPGNTPYVQTLRNKSVESMVGVFKENGYSTSAVHDHYGNFYNRSDVYKNLGFDRFISGETLANQTKVGGWTEDKIMLDPIKKLLNSKKGGNFIFGITVQTHGPYNGDELISPDCPRVTSDILDEKEKIQLENYAYQIEQTDKFIKSVIDIINESDTPTVMFMYGDHLPALGENFSVYEKLKLTNEQKYQTPYVIWNNMGVKKNDEDIASYGLATKVFDELNMEGTEMSKFQKQYKSGQASEEEFKMLQYDILYGDDYLGNKKSYRVDKIQIGLDPLNITSAELEKGKVIIKGTGFTEATRILKDNKEIDTKFIDVNTVEIPNDKVKIGDSIRACYIGLKNGVYYKSDEFQIK